jgi:hypothetical protein
MAMPGFGNNYVYFLLTREDDYDIILLGTTNLGLIGVIKTTQRFVDFHLMASS